MGLKFAGENVYLNDFTDEVIAIRLNDEVHNVKTEYGVQTVPRADIVEIKADGNDVSARFAGQTLVFQKAIANRIRQEKGDWVLGQLVIEDRPIDGAADARMYQLVTPSDLDPAQVTSAFERAGITL